MRIAVISSIRRAWENQPTTKSFVSRLILCGGVLVILATGETVSARTPFMLENTEPATAVAEAAPLQLRGIVSTSAGSLFGIYDPQNNQSIWLSLGQTVGGVTLRSHDLLSDSITAEFQGRTFTIALRTAKAEPMAVSTLASSPEQTVDHIRKEIERRRNVRRANQQALLHDKR